MKGKPQMPKTETEKCSNYEVKQVLKLVHIRLNDTERKRLVTLLIGRAFMAIKEQLIQDAIKCCKEIYFEFDSKTAKLLRGVIRNAWSVGEAIVKPPERTVEGGRHECKCKVGWYDFFNVCIHCGGLKPPAA